MKDKNLMFEKMLDDRLSESDEDLMDDIGLDVQEIVSAMAQQAKAITECDDNSAKPT